MSDGRKLQITFDDRSLMLIARLKVASHRKSTADVVRDALGIYEWMRRCEAEGFVITATNGVRTRELALMFHEEPPR